jgi:hypothetical protein
MACDEAEERCAHCSQRCCPRHAKQGKKGRCTQCEADREELGERRWFAIGYALPLTIFVAYAATLANAPYYGRATRAITTGIPLLDGALLALLFGYFAGMSAVAIRRRWLRPRAAG